MVRDPVLISTVTAMPGDRLTSPVVDLHLRAVERDARAVVQLLAFRLAGLVADPSPLVAGVAPAGLSRIDGVLRDAQHLALQQAVAGEVEGIDLDLGLLPGVDEADVAVRHHGLDLELAVGRHHDQQRLRRRHDAADGVHGELLHDAVDRGGQLLQLGALLGLDQVLREPVRLLLGLGEFVRERVR